MWQTNNLCRFEWMNEQTYLWYKLCVYYHAKTELYDRTLTDLRSPYDPTEAYIQGRERSLSYANARKIRRFVNEAAIRLGIENAKYAIGMNVDGLRYSAQRWIDEYNWLVKNGEMDFINELGQRINEVRL